MLIHMNESGNFLLCCTVHLCVDAFFAMTTPPREVHMLALLCPHLRF